jgi:hypothetical protein
MFFCDPPGQLVQNIYLIMVAMTFWKPTMIFLSRPGMKYSRNMDADLISPRILFDEVTERNKVLHIVNLMVACIFFR